MVRRLAFLALLLLLLLGASIHVWSQSDCDFSYSNYARAVELHDMGDYGPALRHYECARQEIPESVIIPIMIENLHEDIVGASSAWSRNGASTLTPVCNPDENQRALGEGALERGDNSQALIHLQCALLQAPKDETALHLLGRIYSDRGQLPTARYYFTRAEAARNTVEAKRGSGFVMPHWLTPYETAPDTRKSALVEPGTVASNPARLMEQTGELRFRAADRDARRQARQALKSRDLDAAIKWMLKVTDGAGASVDDYDFLASLYGMQADFAGAEASLIEALKLAPTRLDLRCRLGMIYVAQNDAAAAYAQFDWVLSVDVSDICANENRRALSRSLNAAASLAPASSETASPE